MRTYNLVGELFNLMGESIKNKKLEEIKMIKVNITDFNVNWLKIKGACMTTISKQAGKEPSNEW